MINYLRVMLFFCGFIIGAYQKSSDDNQPSVYLRQVIVQETEEVSRDTLTWEDRNY